jgi:hypothetical protein
MQQLCNLLYDFRSFDAEGNISFAISNFVATTAISTEILSVGDKIDR